MAKGIIARITGMGSYLPEKVLSNSDLEAMVDTNDEWIVSRTGMRERRIAAADEFTSDMGAKAGKRALKAAGLAPTDVDMILVATATPDYLMLSTAAQIQAALGATEAAAVDLQAACTGFIYGLSMAKAYVASGMYNNVLLIASEKLSSFVDYEDRTTCVLFGDGASAAVISNQGEGLAIDAVELGADGTLGEVLLIPGGGSRHPAGPESLNERLHFVKMKGREVFKHAVRRMTSASKKCVAQAGIDLEELSWIVPHQANSRIIDAIGKSLEFPGERVYRTVHKYGNTSAATVPIALDELQQGHPAQVGEHLLLVAFGAGLTWGAAVLTKVES